MKITILITLLTLTITQSYASGIFTPADPNEAPSGLTYNVEQPEVKNPNLFAGKRVAILAAHGVQESELVYPYEYLTRRGAQVDIVAPEWSEGRILAVKYLKPTLWIEANLNFQEAQNENYDLIILTGGSWNSNVVRKDENALKLIQENYLKDTLIATICSGAQILINAELANGTTLTGTGSIQDDLENAGATYLHRPVVVDGNIITGRGPSEIKEFMLVIHNMLK